MARGDDVRRRCVPFVGEGGGEGDKDIGDLARCESFAVAAALVLARSIDALGEDEGDPVRGDGEDPHGLTMGEIDLLVSPGGDVVRDTCACEVAVA